MDLRLQLRVFDRGDQLDAAVEVARHQVGGADQHAGLVAALEGVDARVLEEAADDRDDADVLRDPRHAGRRQQIPRTFRSTRTPACDASYSASMQPASTSEFIFRAIRASSPASCAATVR